MRLAVWTVILAAGAGRRMGGVAKALLPFGGTTFLEAIARAARVGGSDSLLVVVGHHEAAVAPLARAVADAVTVNPAPERGMSSSVRCGARAVPDDSAMLVWPVDVPAVQPSTARRVLDAGRSHPGHVVVPVYRGGPGGHPTLLPPEAVAAAREMTGTDRLDRLIERWPVLRLETDDPAIVEDVDTPADLAAVGGGAAGGGATERR